MTTAAAITYSSDSGIPPGVGALVGVAVGATDGEIVGVAVTTGVGDGVTIGDAAGTTPTAVCADDGPYACDPAKFAVITYSPAAEGVQR